MHCNYSTAQLKLDTHMRASGRDSTYFKNIRELAASAQTVSDRRHSRGTPITRVESRLENYQVTLRVSYSLLCESPGMGFISLQTAQLMQELSSKSHAAIMSTCT